MPDAKGAGNRTWSVVGSSNLDWRSTILNNEIDAVVVESGFGADVDAMVAGDVAHALQITPEAWADRGSASGPASGRHVNEEKL